jgi:hypothetical protein
METSPDVEKLALTSADPLTDRRARLRELFPEAESEGRFDVEKLRAVLGEGAARGDERERYGLSWAGKSDALKAIQTLTTATLLPAPGESVNWDSTGHAIIEGDNLEVLKVLQHAYARDGGKVKLIYIDPPYNTGGDFIYPDNYTEGLASYLTYLGQVKDGIKQTTNLDTSGRFHSRWLTMMYPRLFLAHNLLREDGVIFVSIDDHEVSNLRMVMDEIFGEENFIESFIWKKSYGGGAKEQFAVRQHEYCLLYARSMDALDEFWLPPDPEAEARYYKYRDEHVEKRGPYRLKPLEATKSMDERLNLVFPIPAPDGSEVMPKRQWWWSKERVTRVLAENGLVFTKTEGGYSVSYKQYLIKEDGGNRRFILVQLPEPTGREDFPTIAEITKERVRRVIKRMEDERGGELPIGDGTKPDLGFKVFKLAESNFAIWNPALAATEPGKLAEQWKLSADNVRAGAGETALLYELMLKSGLPLDTPAVTQDVAGARVHLLDEGRMLICIARDLTREQLRAMAELKPQSVLCLDVAFKGNDALKVNADLEFQSHGIKFRTA